MDEIEEKIKQVLKESLSISITTEKHYGDYGNPDGVKVAVTVMLDDEEICYSYDYTSL